LLLKYPIPKQAEIRAKKEAFKGSGVTDEEIDAYLLNFLRYDEDQSGELELVEVTKMFEDAKVAKTRKELLQLISDSALDGRRSDGIRFGEYLQMIVKEKTGQIHTGGFGEAMMKAMVTPKQHDASKKTGAAANVFEQKAAQLANEQILVDNQQAKLKAKQKEREAQRVAGEQAKKEKEEDERKKAERQKKVEAFKAGLAKRDG